MARRAAVVGFVFCVKKAGSLFGRSCGADFDDHQCARGPGGASALHVDTVLR